LIYTVWQQSTPFGLSAIDRRSRMSRFRFVFVVFYFTAISIIGVYLRSSEDRIFFLLRKEKVEQNWLTQELRGKQIQLENLINPSTISERLGEEE